MSQGAIEPFNPNVPTSGGAYSTNSLNTAGHGLEPPEPLIFVGYHSAPAGSSQDIRTGPGGQGAGYDPATPNSDRSKVFMTPTQLISAFDKFGRKDFLHFRNLFIAAGLVSENADAQSVRDAYATLLDQIASSGVPVSPMGYVKNLIRMNGLDASKIGSEEKFSVTPDKTLDPWTKTQKSVYDLSPEDARATLEDAMTAKLGRAPTEAEIHDFINAAQTAARRNPTTATATFTPGDTGLTGESSSSVTKNGVTTQMDANGTTVIDQNSGFSAEDISRMAEERAKAAPDYAGYQSVATYFPALMQMLGATTGA